MGSHPVSRNGSLGENERKRRYDDEENEENEVGAM